MGIYAKTGDYIRCVVSDLRQVVGLALIFRHPALSCREVGDDRDDDRSDQHGQAGKMRSQEGARPGWGLSNRRRRSMPTALTGRMYPTASRRSVLAMPRQ